MKLNSYLLKESHPLVGPLGGLLFGFDTADELLVTTHAMTETFRLGSTAALGNDGFRRGAWGRFLVPCWLGRFPGQIWHRQLTVWRPAMCVLYLVSASGLCLFALELGYPPLPHPYPLPRRSFLFRFNRRASGIGGSSVLGPMFTSRRLPR